MLTKFDRMIRFDAEGGAGGGEGETPKANETNNQQAASWEAVLEGLPDEAKQLYQEHTTGLQNALKSERDQRKALADQLREASGKLEKNSETRQQLEAITGELDRASQKAQFYEDAIKPEIGCNDPRLAYLAAQEIKAFDRGGNVNWDALKREYPNLFGKPVPAGNAGSGTGRPPTAADTMDEYIRRRVGGHKI